LPVDHDRLGLPFPKDFGEKTASRSRVGIDLDLAFDQDLWDFKPPDSTSASYSSTLFR
jgi:hypothetical protein